MDLGISGRRAIVCAASKGLGRACAIALANEGGGKFILGVSDRPPRRVVGSAAFSNTAGELRFENISLGGPIWIVQGDTDGNGVSDYEVVLVISPADPITAGDFVL